MTFMGFCLPRAITWCTATQTKRELVQTGESNSKTISGFSIIYMYWHRARGFITFKCTLSNFNVFQEPIKVSSLLFHNYGRTKSGKNDGLIGGWKCQKLDTLKTELNIPTKFNWTKNISYSLSKFPQCEHITRGCAVCGKLTNKAAS